MRSFPWDSLIIGKNEEYNYPIIDRPSSAEDLRELYKTFFTNGVFLNEEDAFQVTPGDGMNVIVAGGKCGIEGTIGYEAAPRGLAIQASSSSADRIDTIVLRWNNNIEVRSIDMYVKTGVAQSVPVRPTLTRSESVWELGIADIFVAKNSGAISTARITDTRLQTDRCGAVTPFAKVDTTGFFDQLQAQTQIAVDLAQDAIDGTLAGNLQSQINDMNETISEIPSKYVTRANTASTTAAYVGSGNSSAPNQKVIIGARGTNGDYLVGTDLESGIFLYDNVQNKTVRRVEWGTLTVKTISLGSYSIAANGAQTVNKSIAANLGGATPLGIVGINTGSSDVYPFTFYLDGTSAFVRLRNVSSSAQTPTLTVIVLVRQ